MTSVVHLSGPVLLGPRHELAQAWVEDGLIRHQRPEREAGARLDGWVIPGLVDAHNHLGLGPVGSMDETATLAQAHADIAAGTLLIRDAGSPTDTRWLQSRDDVPVVIRAGRHIARSRRYLRGVGDEVEPEQLADAVRAQAARGDGWVKLVGDWIDRDSGDLAPCWPAEALVESIAAAHAVGARVTAHCFGEDCLADLLAAGIDCIEHGTGFTAETIAAAAASGASVVPTLINIDTFPDIAATGQEKFPRYAAHMRDLHARRYETVAALHEAGLNVMVGTDAGGTIAHGRVADEIAELITAGLSATQALDAACWGARSWLGRPGLDDGAPADLIVLAADPRLEPATLAHPVAVLRAGRRFAQQSGPGA